jgi:DNA-binding MurR/RpiR family transcriptional regulator
MTSARPQIRAAITANYADLSETLRTAADYLADNQLEIATRSLRAIAAASGVSPASYTRLARAIGFTDYEALREQARMELSQRGSSFQDKARQLRNEADQPLLPRQAAACVDNIKALVDDIDPVRLEQVVDCLSKARRTVVVGALASAGFADYFAYLANWFNDRWIVAGRNGASLGGALAKPDQGRLYRNRLQAPVCPPLGPGGGTCSRKRCESDCPDRQSCVSRVAIRRPSLHSAH